MQLLRPDSLLPKSILEFGVEDLPRLERDASGPQLRILGPLVGNLSRNPSFYVFSFYL
jgi:hypothetical protein